LPELKRFRVFPHVTIQVTKCLYLYQYEVAKACNQREQIE